METDQWGRLVRFAGRTEANHQMVELSPEGDEYPRGRCIRPWEVAEVIEGLGAPPEAAVEGESIRASPEDLKKPIDIAPGAVTHFQCPKRQQRPMANPGWAGAGGH
jgi:hypothetical protein